MRHPTHWTSPYRSALWSPLFLSLVVLASACGGSTEAQLEDSELPSEIVEDTAALSTLSSFTSATADNWSGRDTPERAIDGRLKTYWSTRRSSSWLMGDLGSVREVEGLEVAWHRGTRRVYSFSIAVSSDAKSFRTVYSGKSSKNTNQKELYSFASQTARYVRLTVIGNTESSWNSVSEFGAVLAPGQQPPPEENPDAGTNPEPDAGTNPPPEEPDAGTNPPPEEPDAGTNPPPEEPDAGTNPPPEEPDAGTNPPPAGSAIRLPLEVLGAEGTVKSATFSVSSADASQPLTLWMQIHNMNYANKGSVSVNDSAWVPFNNSTINVEGTGRQMGGIGGGFSTLKMRLALSTGQVRAGENRVSFRFDTSNGNSIGYRVLKFNLLRENGSRVLADSTFVQDDPSTWQAPYTDSASIAEGRQLWHDRQLRKNYKTNELMRARCQDCHAQDGRDLKYFNYSNHSIVERSKFHGLNEEEGKKIAAYIRTLPNVPTPGRPWNPPYQPGPGLDSKPVDQWSAGAGIDAVLERDADMLKYLFPNGITKAAVATTANLSTREMPIYFQLPDWNHWLPTIHPMDAWGDAFVNDKVNKAYAGGGTAAVTSNMRERAARVKAAGYTNYRSELYWPHREWGMYHYNFLEPKYPTSSTAGDTDRARKVYATALWHVVKSWEVMQEFGLEGHQKQLFPSSRDSRGWFANQTFDTSPHMLKLARNNTGINDNGPRMFTYFSMAWYQVSLILFNGNHSDGADRDGQRPVDWSYTHGFVKDLRQETGAPNNALLVEWLVKGMQTADNTQGPNAPYSAGWRPRTSADLSRLVAREWMPAWADISMDDRRKIMEALLSTWWDKTRQYSADAYLNGGEASRSETINGFYDGSLGNRIWYMLPLFKYHGVDANLIDTVANWAQTVWTQADWNRVKTASCAPSGSYVRCSTESF